jgi:DNA-directed RNA polymerase subunit K/omega
MQLTKYECTRIIGMRSLEIQNGSPHLLEVKDENLVMDSTYVAALELEKGLLDFYIRRKYPLERIEQLYGKDLVVHSDVSTLITTKEQNV